MTTNDIDAIRKLTDAATRGPWPVGRDGLHKHEVWLSAFLPVVELSPGTQGEANAAFIGAARTQVPALCDEVEQLRAELNAASRRADNATRKVDGLLSYLDDAHRLDAVEVRSLRNDLADIHDDLTKADAGGDDKPCCGYCGTETPIGVTR